ncbi:hypothetical protein ABE28_004335 [Peribacillus muralis]|uniref:Uncharacterized protein n=1 Tax=Peribacillus muralis TaxID=264697 RepID=A0A1B3XK28_9BACI|nr:hypothetical protein ABE28_004335 [Peribacillus muralis]
MEIWKVSEKVAKFSDVIPKYIFSLFFSCISLAASIILFSGEISWLLPGIIVYPFYIVVPYVIFAVPVQVFLNRYPRKFNLLYLFIYIFFSFIAVFILYIVQDVNVAMNVVRMKQFYELSFSAAVIFWIWDSIFLHEKPE